MGSDPSKLLEYKMRAFNSGTNTKTFARFNINLINECTGATPTVPITSANFDYRVILDGTKYYPVSTHYSFTGDVSATTSCFLFQLN